jgi:hypothetical protein
MSGFDGIGVCIIPRSTFNYPRNVHSECEMRGKSFWDELQLSI